MKAADFPNNLSIGFEEGICNLRCSKCPVHGDGRRTRKIIRGVMPFKRAYKLFDELRGSDSIVNSGYYGEPLFYKNFWKYHDAIKERGIKAGINTNGLLLTEKCAKRLVDSKTDCVFVSIDATTKETLKKVRGINALNKIKAGVFALLKARKNKAYPRVGVSFVVEKSNIHEKEDFVSFWVKYVDTVRVAELYLKGSKKIPKKRKPCLMLYGNMLIHHNGDVPICCLDADGSTRVGNVFDKGIKGVWLGSELQKIRYYHENGQFDKVALCKDCKDWARNYLDEEETAGNILMRRSPLMTYYNRIDRLGTWNFSSGKY